MLKLSKSRKGQWFILSAVFITGTFVLISMVLNSYSFTDLSKSVSNENKIYNDIMNDIQEIQSQGYSEEVLYQYENFIENHYFEKGIEVDLILDPSDPFTDPELTITSEKTSITNS